MCLIETGGVTANSYRYSSNKRRSPDNPPKGIKQKAMLIKKFLQKKIKEYEALQQETRELKQDIQGARK